MSRPGPTVTVLVHDGFFSAGTGAGVSNHAFLRVLCELLAPGVKLTVMPVEVTADSPEYDADWHAFCLELVTRAGGEVVPVSNGTDGTTRWGGLSSFHAASASAAKAVEAAAGDVSPSLTVAFDVPFFGVAALLPGRLATATVNVARSTGALHAPGDHERIAWERGGLLAAVRAGGRAAATSRHIREHLTTVYGVPPTAVTDLVNGLIPGDVPVRSASGGRELLPAGADRSGFMLSFGRAEPYKGFEDLLDALPVLGETGIAVPPLVLGAVTDRPVTAYQKHLANRIERENLDVTLHTRFDRRFRELLAHPALATVIVPSRKEPFGRIALEAIEAGASPVVATTAGGLPEIIEEGNTGYTADPGNPYSLAAAVLRALTVSPDGRRRLLRRGRAVAAERFDYRANVQAFLYANAPWAIREA